MISAPVLKQHGSAGLTLAGKNLTEIFAEIPRGTTRLGVAGKIHDPADVQRVLTRVVSGPQVRSIVEPS